MLVRTNCNIIFAFDKDVEKNEMEEIAEKFPDSIPLYYIYDEDNILNEHESPSDEPLKWEHLIKRNVYKLR